MFNYTFSISYSSSSEDILIGCFTLPLVKWPPHIIYTLVCLTFRSFSLSAKSLASEWFWCRNHVNQLDEQSRKIAVTYR